MTTFASLAANIMNINDKHEGIFKIAEGMKQKHNTLLHQKTSIFFGAAACVLGLSFTVFNVYWALGGRQWIDTVFPFADEAAIAANFPLWVQWSAIILKVWAALFGLVVTPLFVRVFGRRLLRMARLGAWVAACWLTFWGFTQTLFFLLLKFRLFDVDYWNDERVVNWHTFLWDPWFLIWGICLILALKLSARRNNYRKSGIGKMAMVTVCISFLLTSCATLTNDKSWIESHKSLHKPETGNLNLLLAIPELNFFHLKPENETIKNFEGFVGLGIGSEYFYKDNKSLQLRGDFITDFPVFVPAPYDWDESQPWENSHAFNISLTDNFRWKRFQTGYGLNLAKNAWVQHGYYIKPEENKNTDENLQPE